MPTFLSTFLSKFYLVVITVLLTLFITSLFGNWLLSNKVENLQKDIIIAEAETQQEQANNKVQKAEIDKQNTIIESNRTSYEENVKKFEEWRKKPIYRTIIKEVKSDECKDIKNMLDSIRNLHD